MGAEVLLEAAGHGWIAYPAGSPPDDDTRALLESLPVEADTVAVAVAPEVDLTIDRVLDALVTRLRGDAGLGGQHRGVRLVVPYSAGGPESTAARLSRRLAAPVHAPDGPLWIAVDGTLFAGPGPHSNGRWWCFAPSTSPQASGPRYPGPPWQSGNELSGPPTAIDIPAGWWLTGPGRPAPLTPDDLAFDLLPAGDRSLLLLGSPGHRVTGAAVADHLAALPDAHRATCLLTGYDVRQPVARLATEAAARLGEPVRYTGGLPLLADDGQEHLLLSDGDDLIPYGFAAVLEALPDGTARVLSSRPPVHGWPLRDDHVWPLTADVSLEVVPTGLWMRTGGVPVARAQQMRRPADDLRAILVTVEDPTISPAIGAHLVARLPGAHRDRVRFTGPGAVGWPSSAAHAL